MVNRSNRLAIDLHHVEKIYQRKVHALVGSCDRQGKYAVMAWTVTKLAIVAYLGLGIPFILHGMFAPAVDAIQVEFGVVLTVLWWGYCLTVVPYSLLAWYIMLWPSRTIARPKGMGQRSVLVREISFWIVVIYWIGLLFALTVLPGLWALREDRAGTQF